MLKLKLQYFGHLMWRPNSLEKTDVGKNWRQEEEGVTEEEMVGWHDQLNGASLSKLRETVRDREAWCVEVHGVTRSS